MVPGEEKKLTKRVVKAMKVYQHVDESYYAFNENEFTFFFLRPNHLQILENNNLSMKFGESHLKSVIKHTNDEARADVGPRIDAIISSAEYGFEIGIVEVSGPRYKVDKTHFLGDRAKISKNLKYLHKQIEKATPTPNLSSLKKLRLYGLQVYLNTIHVYSISKASSNYYVFLREKKVDIPANKALRKDQLPHFFYRLWTLSDMYNKSTDCLQGIFEASTAETI